MRANTDMKSISQHLRESKKQQDQKAREAAMIASISPAKYRPTQPTEPHSDSDARSNASAGVRGAVSLCVPHYVHEELAAGLTILKRPTPINNMGVTENEQGEQDDDGTELIALKPKGHQGKYELVRVPSKQSGVDHRAAFVDQCSFTVSVYAAVRREVNPPYADKGEHWPTADAVPRLSTVLLYIFGFGVTAQFDRGRNFYKESWSLGEKGEYGALSVGGNGDTCNIQITGQGCMAARPGWEKRLYDYLKAVGGKFSRVDVAADFYQGQYTPVQAEIDYLEGKMSLTNRRPFAERRGDWYGEGGKTFYIGKRTSGKMTRIYEKGKMLLGMIAAKHADLDENQVIHALLEWVRIETEWHNVNREIPLEILLNPAEYLAGAHPAFTWINEIQNRIETKKKAAVATVERAVQITKNQMGAWLYALMAVKGPGVIREIVREQVPAWAKQFGELPPLDDETWITWEKELASIPF